MSFLGNNQYSGLTLPERFEQKVELIPFTTCHWWAGGLDTHGYGQFSVDGKANLAHRVSYELYKGAVTDGLQVLHTCDQPLCVNPDHLFLGTHQDNMDDKVKKGRQSALIGERNPKAVLTEGDVREIRASGKSQKDLANEYGVGQTAISRVLLRQSWKHVA